MGTYLSSMLASGSKVEQGVVSNNETTEDDQKLVALEKALLDESADPVDLPFSLLKSITGDFSEAQEIGRGGFGVVYKGVLPSGGTVAVKKLYEKFEILDKNFKSEVACLIGVKHKNTVRFLGHCSETQHMMMPYEGKLVCAEERQRLLCFEYLPKRCLTKYISDASCGLEWATRYQIILGVCEGIHYLHRKRIIHMDLKPQNILLDNNMVPRIADFGLSRRLSESKSRAITENMIGTNGYMAPEFIKNGEITFKTDIYSLGVIIMEILMGQKERSNVKEVVESWTKKFGTSKSQTTLEQVIACAETGIQCINYQSVNRPPTWFIIERLLGKAKISDWSLTSDAAASTKGQTNLDSKLEDEPEFMDNSAITSQPQPLVLEVVQEDGKVCQQRNVKETTVSVAIGVMSTLNAKLTTLMGDEYNKRREVRKQASFLQKELRTINAALEQLELMDELAPGVKNWRDDVREISYDMENCIDDFMCQFGGKDAEACFVGEATELHKRLCELHRIANQMEELKTLMVEANARRESYKIDYCKPSSSFVYVDPRLSAVYQEATNLVGIEGPREQLASWLMGTEKNLKVMSIVGFGGLGKTTLAKQVFDKISGQFSCVAFFPVSQRPDMRVLLNGLLLKLEIEEPYHDPRSGDIIEEIRKYLSKKRYLIVVDDLWDQSAWRTISCAFPESGNGSRIIVTTRVEDVAGLACQKDRECIYRMKPLNGLNSKMLFSNRVFGPEVVCPPYLKDVAAEILKKCGGLPLAIITIASLLAAQVGSRKHWESIRKSLGAQSVLNPTLKEMNSILNLSYKHLPFHLRACFLYLGMYPEDHIIWRDDLIKQWIAEGFVSNLHGLDLEAVGRSYFNELVNRSMILPWNTMYGEVLSCRVHDMMLNLIISKCVEDNFISVAYNSEHLARLLHGCKYKVRRLSLSSMAIGGATYDTTIAASLSQVRSFILFKNPIPPLSWFKYLRMLNIARVMEIADLTAINQLFLLRYLMVRVYCIEMHRQVEYGRIKLPAKLCELIYLETMDIQDCRLINSLPSDLVHLPRLSHLVLPDFTHLPEGIENMKSLHTLQGLDLRYSSLECIRSLGKLTNLRKLSMRIDYDMSRRQIDALACSIGKLNNLEYMFISGGHFDEGNDQKLGSLSNPFQYMEGLHLIGWWLCRVPKWMCDLNCLRFLQLQVNETSSEEVHLLGKLPSLIKLNFGVDKLPNERAILGTGLFPILEFFYFHSWKDSTGYLGFEGGAMPNLRILCLSAIRWGGTIPVGMEHLLHLQKIRVLGASNDAVAAFKEALLVHPNRPSVFSGTN